MSNEIIRRHKDTLFQMAFKDNPEAALSLYNAVNNSNYTDASMLKYELLDGGLFLRMQNDNGFVLDQTLNLYEHQGSMNPNMPLRGLFYYADLYRQLIPDHRRLYHRALIKIPVPKYIVFYNGTEDMGGERKLLRLSDAFEKEDETHGFEWTATMININQGYNQDIMERCQILRDYVYFVDLARQYRKDMAPDEAVMKAMQVCMETDVFKNVLVRYKEEIEKMSFYEFSEEDFADMIREEEQEKIERERKRADAAEERADAAEERADAAEEKAIKELIKTVQEFGGTKKQAQQKIEANYPKYKERAGDLVDRYWE